MAWSQWMPLPVLPSPFTSAVSVAVSRVGNSSGRMMAFVIARDGGLYRITDSVGDTWEPWVRSAPSSGQDLDVPRLLWLRLGVGRNKDGRLELFAVSKEQPPRTLWHTWQQSPTDDSWSDWTPFYAASAPFEIFDMYVGSNQDGRLEAFVGSSENGRSYHIYQTWQSAANNGWSGIWHDMGWPDAWKDSNGSGIYAPIVGSRDGQGRQQLFIAATVPTISTNATPPIASTRQTVKNEGWTQWFDDIGSVPGAPRVPLYVLPNDDGRLELFAFDYEGHVQHTWQLPTGQWFGTWHDLGAPPDTPNGTLFIPPIRLADGRLSVLLYQYNGTNLYQVSQLAPNNGWGDWTVAAQAPLPPIEEIQSAIDRHGRIQLFGKESGGYQSSIWRMREV